VTSLATMTAKHTGHQQPSNWLERVEADGQPELQIFRHWEPPAPRRAHRQAHHPDCLHRQDPDSRCVLTGRRKTEGTASQERCRRLPAAAAKGIPDTRQKEAHATRDSEPRDTELNHRENRMPKRRILELALAAVTIASAVGLTTSAATAAQTPATAAASASLTATAWTGTSRAVSHPSAVTGSCASVRRELRQDANRGIRRVMCVRTTQKTAPSALPSLCQVNEEDYNRFEDCLETGWTLSIIDTDTGAVVGTVTGNTILWNELSYKSRTWNENIEVQIIAVTDDGADTTFNAPIVCNDATAGDCEATGTGTWAGQTGFLGPTEDGDIYTGELGWESASTATTTMTFQVNMTFDNPIATPATGTIGPTTTIRCDSMAIFKPTKGGCVYSAATLNVLEISTADTTVTAAAEFIKTAQGEIASHPGEYGSAGPVGPALTRLTNKAEIKANRKVACKGLTVPAGDSCDEYPFASTYQGAALAGKANTRSKAVNAKQNSKVGSYLSSFFLKFRIADSDSFYVYIVS
jgi:hypothetical protein